MIELSGDIWDFHVKGYWVCVTTSGAVKTSGDAVMGRGVALEASKRFPELPRWLGQRINLYRNEPFEGNTLNPFPDIRVICFPTKWNWTEKSNLCLIAVSASELRRYVEEAYIKVRTPVYLPRPGCGNGGLDWDNVKPILEKYLDDRFAVVSK